MTVAEAMNALEHLGFSFRLAERGEIKFRSSVERPPEAAALLDIVRTDRASAADYIRQRESGATVVDDGCTYSVMDALAIAQAVRRGDAVLLAPVIFHKQALNVTVCWEPTHGIAGAVLEWHRERLKNTLQGRLQTMEQQPLDGMSAEEVEALCDKYTLYKTLMEVCR